MKTESSIQCLFDTIQRLQDNIKCERDIEGAYKDFVDFITGEMESALPNRTARNNKRKGKSFYKPYWNEDLQFQWDNTQLCEREWS